MCCILPYFLAKSKRFEIYFLVFEIAASFGFRAKFFRLSLLGNFTSVFECVGRILAYKLDIIFVLFKFGELLLKFLQLIKQIVIVFDTDLMFFFELPICKNKPRKEIVRKKSFQKQKQRFRFEIAVFADSSLGVPT